MVLQGGSCHPQKYDPDLSFNEVDFSFSDYWIQIYGLPLNRQHDSSLQKIETIIGSFVETDLSVSGGGGGCHFVRVKKLWKEESNLWIFGSWLRAEVNEYHPGIDLEGLRTANIAECDLRAAGFFGDACVLGTQAGPSQTQWEEAVQLALDSWHELQQREPMDQYDNLVVDDIVDPLSRDGKGLRPLTDG
uniref:Uncharacterized protein n=1 Tax=Fagus sylvatica TaxID=28930 RepID=A0A2N9GCS6_FAGSY